MVPGMNRRVSVWKYVKIGDRWRYCKPVYGANNKIKPHWVYVKGKPEEHPEGNFYIHKLDHGTQVWKKIGPNPADAVRTAEYEASLLRAVAMGLPIKEETPDLTYGPQMWKFLEDYKLSQSDESYALMSQTLVEFNEQCKKNDLTKITREPSPIQEVARQSPSLPAYSREQDAPREPVSASGSAS